MTIEILTIAQTVIGIVAIVLALVALNHQRREIERSAEMNALSALSQIFEQRIAHVEGIIQGKKAAGLKYTYLCDRVNKELVPCLESTHDALVDAFRKYNPELDLNKIETVLKGDDYNV